MNKNKLYPRHFVMIPLILFTVFIVVPSILGIGYSFTDWNAYNMDTLNFVGLENYKEIFQGGSEYLKGIMHTLSFTVVTNIIKLIPALFLAILLIENMRGRGFYRTILYLPSVLPYLIVGLIFTSILSYRTGILNRGLSLIGLDFLKQKWLGDLNIVWKTIYGVDAWRGIGYVMTIFMSGLVSIPKSYFEAAAIDGAGFFQRLRYVTIPMLRGAIIINLVFGLTYGLKVFDIIYVLTNGGPGHATEVAATYAYKLYSTGKYAASTAINTIIFLITAGIGILIVRKLTKGEVQQ